MKASASVGGAVTSVRQITTPDGRMKEQVRTGRLGSGVHLNVQTSHSGTRTDLIDINGDGLPDILTTTIRRDDAGNLEKSLKVRLNLGYRLGKAETWGNIELTDQSTLLTRRLGEEIRDGTLGRTENLTTGITHSVSGGIDIGIVWRRDVKCGFDGGLKFAELILKLCDRFCAQSRFCASLR